LPKYRDEIGEGNFVEDSGKYEDGQQTNNE